MFENTKQSVRLVGGTTAVSLALGIGAVIGVVPKLVSTRAFTASVSEPGAASVLDDSSIDATAVTATVVPTTVVVPSSPPPTVTKVAVPRAAALVPVPAATSAQAPAPASTIAPRTQATSAQINQAIQGLRPYVFLFSPSPAQVTQAGDQVCTAFDQGKTFAEVKALGLAAVAKVPLISVSAGAADYVVRTGVALFCPAYQSKLV
ncbi:MAG: hypothetical protein ACRD0Q_00530 [Acidimicrobiales bacterium]